MPNGSTLLTGLVVFGAFAAVIVWGLRKRKRRKGGCSGGCGGCPGRKSCHPEAKRERAEKK